MKKRKKRTKNVLEILLVLVIFLFLFIGSAVNRSQVRDTVQEEVARAVRSQEVLSGFELWDFMADR